MRSASPVSCTIVLVICTWQIFFFKEFSFLHPRPAYILKVPTNVAIYCAAGLCPPPFQDPDQEKSKLA